MLTGPNRTVQTRSASNAQGSAGGFRSSTGAEGAGYAGVNGNRGGAVRTANGDVYAGRDGNAYQHTSGSWSKWENGGWQQLEQDRQARTFGERQQFGGFRQAGGGGDCQVPYLRRRGTVAR